MVIAHEPYPPAEIAAGHFRLPRKDQPCGGMYDEHESILITRYYRGKEHEYTLYRGAVADPDTGMEWPSGYYDENGVRYDKISVPEEFCWYVFTCGICGKNHVIRELTDGRCICPDCGVSADVYEKRNGISDSEICDEENVCKNDLGIDPGVKLYTRHVPIRRRTGQPTGYDDQYEADHPYMPSYHCAKHDYIFFPDDWNDMNTGEIHKHGYYDEEGKFYNTVLFEDLHFRYRFKCDRCGAEAPYATGDSDITKMCPGCGMPLTSLIEDLSKEDLEERRSDLEKTIRRGRSDV